MLGPFPARYAGHESPFHATLIYKHSYKRKLDRMERNTSCGTTTTTNKNHHIQLLQSKREGGNFFIGKRKQWRNVLRSSLVTLNHFSTSNYFLLPATCRVLQVIMHMHVENITMLAHEDSVLSAVLIRSYQSTGCVCVWRGGGGHHHHTSTVVMLNVYDCLCWFTMHHHNVMIIFLCN